MIVHMGSLGLGYMMRKYVNYNGRIQINYLLHKSDATSGTHSQVLKLMSHYYLYFFPSYILIQETTYVLSSTLRPNLANQICGQAEVVICEQALIYIVTMI